MPGAVAMLRPLTDALWGSQCPKTVVEWMAQRQTTFKAARAALGKATNLAYPRLGADLGLMVDASADHVGAALQQRTGPAAGWQPLGFLLVPTQRFSHIHVDFVGPLTVSKEGYRYRKAPNVGQAPISRTMLRKLV